MRRLVARLRGETAGVALVEFALVLPFMLLLYLGGFQLADAVVCNRKVTISARAVGDLVSRSDTMSKAKLDVILNAATQIMAPYAANNALIRVSEVTTSDAKGNATVTWSRAINGLQRVPGTAFTLPTGTWQANTAMIFAEVNYAYTPIVAFGAMKPMSLTQSVYMMPRLSSDIPCADCTSS